jgi:DNA primase
LVKYLSGKKKYPIEVLEQAGLVILGRGGRYYDRFRGRLIFPLKNHRGQVVGFSGRVLDPEVKEAKYINSPETMVYHKSEMLFGLAEQFQAIRKADEVVVVEGEFDVLSSVQAKVANVVAIKGSAFTDEQARLLKRSVSKVILALDRDQAGIEATRRAITIANDHNLELRVADPDLLTGKDPDDLARENPKQWRQAVKQAISGYEFLIQAALAEFDQSTPEGKRQIMQQLAPVLDTIPHAVEQDFYLKKVAQALNVREDLVKKDITTVMQRLKLGQRPTSPKSDDESHSDRPNTTRTKPLSRQENLEEYALFLLLHSQPDQIPAQAERLKHIKFYRPGVDHLIQTVQTMKQVDLEQLMKQLPEDTQQLVFELHLHPRYLDQLEEIDLAKEWQTVVEQLINLDINREIEQITTQLNKLDRKQAQTDQDEAQQQHLLERIVKLRQRQTIR